MANKITPAPVSAGPTAVITPVDGDDYLRFTQDWRIPPDNNGSERDIRMIKLRQKVSGCLRTLTGARQFCAIRSYLSTAAKHGKHFFEVLVMLTAGHPWMPTTS